MTGGNFLKRNVKTGVSRQKIHVIFWCKKEKESSIIDSVAKSSSHLSKLSRKKITSEYCLLLVPGTVITNQTRSTGRYSLSS